MDPVRLGLVGLGRLAEVGYLPALRDLRSAELVAVADVHEERCARLAPGVPAYADADALVAGADVELVVVATPPSSHLAAATAAAAAGVATLVEKPPAETLDEAHSLAALLPSPWVGLNRRFDGGVGRLRHRVETLEPPLELTLAMSIRPEDWGALTAVPGPLLDVAPHLADLALWLTGRECTAVRGGRVSEDEASFELVLEGAQALVVASHARGWRESVTVRDASGSRVGLKRGGLARRVHARLAARAATPLAATLRSQLDAACDAVRLGIVDERLASAHDGLVLMRILDAARRSARAGGERVELTAERAARCSR